MSDEKVEVENLHDGESCGDGCRPAGSALPVVATVNDTVKDGGEVPAGDGPRWALLRHSLGLEYITVCWSVVEGAVSVAAALGAGSVALLGFGMDSFVETISGVILIWRLRAERGMRDREAIDRLDRRAHKLVAFSLFALAAFIAFEAAKTLIAQERPDSTLVGMIVTSLSLVVMWYLARAKRWAAAALESRALKADSFQTTACFWLSLITLAGIVLNAAFGWWWADPIAALGMTWFLVSEGREAWKGEDACSCGSSGAT